MAIATRNSWGNDPWYEKERSLPYLLQRQAEIILGMPVIFRVGIRSLMRLGIDCEFYYRDRIFIGFLPEGCDVSALIIEEKIKPRCVSCGKEGLCIIHDWQGRCSTTLSDFWKRVRKVYWHRYSKNKIN